MEETAASEFLISRRFICNFGRLKIYELFLHRFSLNKEEEEGIVESCLVLPFTNHRESQDFPCFDFPLGFGKFDQSKS